MRQAKIYVRLPSNGAYWEKGSIEWPANGELAVYSMTAKDELAFKTPDALLNGQAVVDVIQSCIPAIKDAWKTPNIDLDSILAAIRIATYGEKMDVTHTVPNTTEQVTHIVDLRLILDQLSNNTRWDEKVVINDQLSCFIRPLTYRHLSLTSLKTFETQRLMQAVNDEALSDERKLEIFNQSFNKMTDITVELVADSIYAVQTPETVVEDSEFIKEFVQNADKDVFQKVQERITELKKTNDLKPLLIKSTPDLIALGAPETYELPISFDNSDFFGQGS
jgi:hypothetical protein